MWSVDGLDLAESAAGRLLGVSVGLRRSLRLLSPFAEDVVNVLAVASVEVDAEAVCAVLGELHPGATPELVRPALTQLVEAEHVVLGQEGYRLREANVHPEIVAWMRPHLRQQLRRLVADHVPLPVSRRLPLLIAAGEHVRAATLGADALERAEARGDGAATVWLRQALAEIPVQKRAAVAVDGGSWVGIDVRTPATSARVSSGGRSGLREPGLRSSPLLETVQPPRRTG
jgi:hypothetical protein